MIKKASEFKNYLHNQGFRANVDDQGDVVRFIISEKIEAGPTIKVIVFYEKDYPAVRFMFLDFASTNKASKEIDLYKFINKLNYEYMSSVLKFILDESNDEILLLASTEIINPENVVSIIGSALRVLNEEYSRFMKLLWS